MDNSCRTYHTKARHSATIQLLFFAILEGFPVDNSCRPRHTKARHSATIVFYSFCLWITFCDIRADVYNLCDSVYFDRFACV